MVFICTFDPFGRGLYRYTFENWCGEADQIPRLSDDPVFLEAMLAKYHLQTEED